MVRTVSIVCALAAGLMVFASVLTTPREAHADCVQNGISVVCSGRDDDGFLSTDNDLIVDILPGTLMRNFDTFERRGECPIAFPSVQTGDRATVTNEGFMFVRGVCGIGIQTGANSTITNLDHIETLDILGFGIDAGVFSMVINEDEIITREFLGYGVFADDNVTVINRAGAIIQTDGIVASGINGRTNVAVTNAGLIQTNGNGAHAVDLLNGGTVTNTGLIEVNGFQSAGVRVRSGAAAIVNGGTIRSTYTGASNLNAPEDGMLLDVSAAAIENSGSIAMTATTAAGIRVLMTGAGPAGVTNSGAISAPGGGVAITTAGGPVTVTNSGTITATGTDAPGLEITGAAELVQITNTGVITGTGGIAVAATDDRDELTNSGTLDGAVLLAGGNDLLTLQTGTSLTGPLDGGAGTDDLTLFGSGVLNVHARGFEELIKLGDGTWALAGDYMFTNRVRILQGTLALSAGDSVATDQFDVFLGGTLRLTDAVVYAAGPALSVSGAANLDGALEVSLTGSAPIADGARIRVLSAGSVNGAFTSVAAASGAFLSADAAYSNTAVDVVFSRLPYVSAARTANATAVAAALDRGLAGAPETSYPLYLALDGTDAAAAAVILTALGDDTAAALSGLDILASRDAMNTMIAALREPGTWGQVSREWGGFANSAGNAFDRRATAYAAGATLVVDDSIQFGVSLAQTDYRAVADASPTRVTGQATQFGVGVSTVRDTWRAAAGIAIGTLDGTLIRTDAFDSAMLLDGRPGGSVIAAAARATRSVAAASTNIEWSAGATVTRTKRGAFTELGGGSATLLYRASSNTSARGVVSARASGGFGSSSPEFEIELSHEFADPRIETDAALAMLPDADFSLGLALEERTWVSASARLPFAIAPGLELAVTAGGVLTDKTGGHRIGLDARWRW
jgi:hypothetical protein